MLEMDRNIGALLNGAVQNQEEMLHKIDTELQAIKKEEATLAALVYAKLKTSVDSFVKTVKGSTSSIKADLSKKLDDVLNTYTYAFQTQVIALTANLLDQYQEAATIGGEVAKPVEAKLKVELASAKATSDLNLKAGKAQLQTAIASAQKVAQTASDDIKALLNDAIAKLKLKL